MAELVMHHQKSFMAANKVTDTIKECNHMPVAAKEWCLKKKNKY